MSIITTVEAVPSRLFAIYATLFDSENGEPKDRIESWATPLSLSKSGSDEGGGPTTKLFVNSLLEARKLGLVEEADGKLRLTADARGNGKKGQSSEVFFRNYLNHTLFDPSRANDAQQAGFMLALAWFLSANPLTPMSFSEDPSFAIKAEIGENARKTECTTLLNYQSFLYWARYLGFATIVGNSNSRRAIPDPARAIDAVLPVVFGGDVELPIQQFLSRLAAVYPVFETGSVRQSYDAMRPISSTDAAYRLSIATSIALQRLSDRQRIVLNSVADAPARVLVFGARESRVSHIATRGSLDA
ncbi:protein DpdG [Mesorhizobium sp. ES1-6]|uniref:protein DpdG n=1 Tax=Mesorhizobium sp. ES1-6 TaxID=2876626 RepID=UPI001CC9B919|nr:protein DpdG [Mesorhizobium sp. ES1-6]MBZ9803381.1 hypothetical protein [Mesorhizobium sp. ES1-6]